MVKREQKRGRWSWLKYMHNPLSQAVIAWPKTQWKAGVPVSPKASLRASATRNGMSSGGHQATKINHLSIKFEKRQRNEEENWSLSHFEGWGSRVPTSGSRTLSTGGKSNFALATVMIVQRLLFSVQFSKSSNTKPCQYCQYLLTINLVIFSGSPTDLLNGGKTAMFPKDQQVLIITILQPKGRCRLSLSGSPTDKRVEEPDKYLLLLFPQKISNLCLFQTVRDAA